MISPGSVHRGYKNIKRYQTIVTVLIRHGFYDFVDHNNLMQFVQFRKRFLPGKKYPHDNEASMKLSRWQRVRFVLEELGPAFVKLGQFISNRPDLIPKELCTELEALLDSVSPFDGELARTILEKELDRPIETVYSEFNISPLSSASISQVHEARLLNGTKVAVKIQRPNIKEQIETDLEVMSQLARMLEKFDENIAALHPVDIIEDFKQDIGSELDFTNEAANINRFSTIFENETRVHIPAIYKDFSTKHILTMEFIEGVKLAKAASMPEKYDPEIITDIIADIVLKQVFEMGFFHADPHSGNIIVQDNNVICFIDFGLVGILPPKHKEYLCEIIMGLVTHDSERITSAVISLSQNKEIENRSKLDYQVFKIVEHYAYIPLADINIGQFLSEILKLIIDNKLRVPSDMYMLLKALISLEGTVRKLKPDFDTVKHIAPFVRKLIAENANPVKIMKDLYRCGIKYSHLIQELPNSVKEIIDQFKNKTTKIQFEHKGLEPMLQKHDQISNRIAYSIVTAAMLISSSLLLHAKIPPTFHETSILGILAFIFALILGSFLLISILRHGRM